jgi:hypothetical protein
MVDSDIRDLGGLSEAAVQAIGAAVQGERMALNVENVRAQAERLLVAAGIAALPPITQEGARLGPSGRDSCGVLAAAHAAALVAAAELREAVDQLRREVATASAVTEWKNALAPRGNPARAVQLGRLAEAFGAVNGASSRGEHRRAIELFAELSDEFPWFRTFVNTESTAQFGRPVDQFLNAKIVLDQALTQSEYERSESRSWTNYISSTITQRLSECVTK